MNAMKSGFHLPAAGAGLPTPDDARTAHDAPPSFARVALRHLRTPRDIERVLPLREGIDLSVHRSDTQLFMDLEKKETNSGSSVRSSSMAS